MPTRRYDPVRLAWPSWKAVYERWATAQVPDVDIISFRPGKDYVDLPWFNRKDSHHLLSTNPERDTAFHLCQVLPSYPTDMRAAYKLYAFCRDQQLHDFPSNVLASIFETHTCAFYEWWHANAKHVLPYNSRANSVRMSGFGDDRAPKPLNGEPW